MQKLLIKLNHWPTLKFKLHQCYFSSIFTLAVCSPAAELSTTFSHFIPVDITCYFPVKEWGVLRQCTWEIIYCVCAARFHKRDATTSQCTRIMISYPLSLTGSPTGCLRVLRGSPTLSYYIQGSERIFPCDFTRSTHV
jgi:hypothetical protein